MAWANKPTTTERLHPHTRKVVALIASYGEEGMTRGSLSQTTLKRLESLGLIDEYVKPTNGRTRTQIKMVRVSELGMKALNPNT